MPSQAMGRRCLRIAIRVGEPDLKDALLILHAYSCFAFSLAFDRVGRADPVCCTDCNDNVTAFIVEIAANCHVACIPALIDELNAAFGATFDFRAVLSGTTSAPSRLE